MKLTLWRGGVVALALSTLFAAAGTPIVSSFSTDAAVVAAATAFSDWLLVIPLAGVVSFVFDGVFIGATWTRAMLLTMAAAVAVDIVALELAAPLGNHGLWLAFTLFLAARALAQAALLPSLARRTFAPIVATD
jgi:MATE family multidrug resistance protein